VDRPYRRPVTIAQPYLAALDLEPAEPSLALLTRMTRRHVATLAFGSIGPRLGDDLPLDAESLLDRIVVRRRGGYCFEQNGLLFEVLQELGFDARIQLARVIHNQDVHPGLTHRVTLVEVEGRDYVVDVGFGPLGPPTPVPLPTSPAADDDAPFRVHEARPGELHMQSIVDGSRYSLYRFDLVRYGPSDCELGHFYSHRHPEATFVNNLVASLILDDEVRSLRNRQYWVVRDTATTTTDITSAEQLRILLSDELGIRVSEAEGRRLFDELPRA
jgi:N-hydroxyarylamine O-acetyltransferase